MWPQFTCRHICCRTALPHVILNSSPATIRCTLAARCIRLLLLLDRRYPPGSERLVVIFGQIIKRIQQKIVYSSSSETQNEPMKRENTLFSSSCVRAWWPPPHILRSRTLQSAPNWICENGFWSSLVSDPRLFQRFESYNIRFFFYFQFSPLATCHSVCMNLNSECARTVALCHQMTTRA